MLIRFSPSGWAGGARRRSSSGDDTFASQPGEELPAPFAGLKPAPQPAGAAWVVEATTGRAASSAATTTPAELSRRDAGRGLGAPGTIVDVLGTRGRASGAAGSLTMRWPAWKLRPLPGPAVVGRPRRGPTCRRRLDDRLSRSLRAADAAPEPSVVVARRPGVVRRDRDRSPVELRRGPPITHRTGGCDTSVGDRGGRTHRPLVDEPAFPGRGGRGGQRVVSDMSRATAARSGPRRGARFPRCPASTTSSSSGIRSARGRGSRRGGWPRSPPSAI